jgi:hypothetical protein
MGLVVGWDTTLSLLMEEQHKIYFHYLILSLPPNTNSKNVKVNKYNTFLDHAVAGVNISQNSRRLPSGKVSYF